MCGAGMLCFTERGDILGVRILEYDQTKMCNLHQEQARFSRAFMLAEQPIYTTGYGGKPIHSLAAEATQAARWQRARDSQMGGSEVYDITVSDRL